MLTHHILLQAPVRPILAGVAVLGSPHDLSKTAR